MAQTPEEKAAAKAAKAAKDAEKAAAKAASEAHVYSHSGGHIRTYTREVHGDEFEDLARQMADQHQGSRIDVR